MEAFVYTWTDMKTNKLYVGWHKGSVDDGYICSSKVMLEEYRKRPYDFNREIVATGSTRDMISLESAILRSEKVATNEQYYNMHENNGKFIFTKHSEASKQKMRGPKSENAKRNMSINHADVSGKNNPMFGRSVVIEKKLKWYNNGNKEIYISENTQPKEFIPGRLKGTKREPRSAEWCKKISMSKQGASSFLKGHRYKIVECPHCKKHGGGGNMTRFHFENCKEKNNGN
jgi:hypothetical protein